jgi:hypothetical protein
MAADEIDRFRREIVERTGDICAGDRPFAQVAVAALGKPVPERGGQRLRRLGLTLEIRGEKVTVGGCAGDRARVEHRPIRSVKRQIGRKARDTDEILFHAQAGRLDKLLGKRRVPVREVLREQRPAASKRGADMRGDHRFFEAAAERAKRTLAGFIDRQRAGGPVGKTRLPHRVLAISAA